MHDDRLVLHERAASLVITPDALRLRVGRRTSEHAPEHLQSGVDPVLLVDRSIDVVPSRSTLGTNRTLLRPPLKKA